MKNKDISATTDAEKLELIEALIAKKVHNTLSKSELTTNEIAILLERNSFASGVSTSIFNSIRELRNIYNHKINTK